MTTDPEALALNRALWAQVNAQHTDRAAALAWLREDLLWGMFGAPESELTVLGEVTGRRVLELGAGTAYVSAWLARRGAEVVALDLSEHQLGTAGRLQTALGPRFPLVQGDGESLPLATASFDVLVSEHGVGVWCDPTRWVPEAARVLRPGGRLVFLVNSLLSALCVPPDAGPAGTRLLRGVADLATIRWPGGGIEHHPSHGRWIDLLGSNGFVVERLTELYAPAAAADPEYYGIVTADWARRWPAEEMWTARRAD